MFALYSVQDAVLSQGVPRDARYISKFSAALGGFDNNAFELNNSINYGKIRVFNLINLLPLNSC